METKECPSPLISPFSGDTTSTLAHSRVLRPEEGGGGALPRALAADRNRQPASFNCASGTSSSDCSNPWVARIATRLPESLPVVVDQGVIISRHPGDLDAFSAKIIEEIAEGRHTQRSAA